MKFHYYIMISILGWGIGSFLYKYANQDLHPIMVALISLITYVLILPLAFVFMKVNTSITTPGVIFTIVSSIFMCIGTLCFSFALKSGGQVGTVTVLTTMYPILTLILSYLFLGETLTLKKLIGIGFAIISFILIGL